MNRLALALLLAPVAAAAQKCPTAADMDAGVRIVFADGKTVDFVTMPAVQGGIFSVRRRADGGRDLDWELGQGLYLLSLVPYADDGKTPEIGWLYDYDTAADALPMPSAGSQALLHVSIAGRTDIKVNHVYDFGEATAVEIGGCGYDALPVILTGDTFAQEIMWLPELGLSYRVADQDGDERSPRPAPVMIMRTSRQTRPGRGGPARRTPRRRLPS